MLSLLILCCSALLVRYAMLMVSDHSDARAGEGTEAAQSAAPVGDPRLAHAAREARRADRERLEAERQAWEEELDAQRSYRPSGQIELIDRCQCVDELG